jgi:hypothetical protein
MNKILTILILGLLIFGTIGVIATPEKNNIENKILFESILISEPIIKEENDFISIYLEESNSYLLEPNNPMLPTITRVYTLPFKTDIHNIKVNYFGNNEILLNKHIKPVNIPTPINSRIKSNQDYGSYSLTKLYPEEKFTYTLGSGILNHERVLFLSVKCFPISYNPTYNILNYCNNFEIEISYNEGSYKKTAQTDYDLVIISPETFSSNLQKLIDHKNNHGINSYIKNVEEIYDEFPGRDDPEKIKNYVKYAIETFDISYVLLIGSLDHIPIRMTNIGWHYSTLNLPTDLYFSDVYDENGDFCTWDANENNIFGEYNWDDGNIDEVDLYADVYLGRIPCQRNLDLNIVLKKIISYENNAYGKNWFKRILLLGGDTFPHHGIIEGEFVTSRIAEEMIGFNPIFLWTSEKTFRPLIINSEATRGAGFISYSGHGYVHGFGTSPPDVERRIEYFDWYLPGMLNINKYSIVFFDACLTATLDYKLFNFINFPGIAYNFVKKPIGGAVAAIGATRIAFTDVDWKGVNAGAGYLNLHFFMNYEEGITVSEMLTKSQNDYINYVYEDCITIEEFILIGDPSLKVGGYP